MPDPCKTGELPAAIATRMVDPVNRRWSDPVGATMVISIDARTGFPFPLPNHRSLDETP